MKPITIPDSAIHDDWYCDGAEDGEQLWRLDFCDDRNSYQAQLFARLGSRQWKKIDDGTADTGREQEGYVSFRLLLERDNRGRVDDDDCARVDYASHSWPLSKKRALALLALCEEKACDALAEERRVVTELPCQWELCDIPGPGGKKGSRHGVL